MKYMMFWSDLPEQEMARYVKALFVPKFLQPLSGHYGPKGSTESWAQQNWKHMLCQPVTLTHMPPG